MVDSLWNSYAYYFTLSILIVILLIFNVLFECRERQGIADILMMVAFLLIYFLDLLHIYAFFWLYTDFITIWIEGFCLFLIIQQER